MTKLQEFSGNISKKETKETASEKKCKVTIECEQMKIVLHGDAAAFTGIDLKDELTFSISRRNKTLTETDK